MSDNPLELEDGVDLDPLCPVCNDTGWVLVAQSTEPDKINTPQFDTCPCGWIR